MTDPRENADDKSFATSSTESFATNITGHESHGSATGASTCACGKTKIVVGDGVEITDLRCPHCPSEKPKPTLRLVPDAD